MELDTIVCADALEFLQSLPDASVDACITDPPYGINYASSRTTRNDGSIRTTPMNFGDDVFNGGWLSELSRSLKVGGAMYMFTRWDVAHLWKQAIEDSGLKVVQRLIWYKAHWKMGDLRYFGSQTEDILFCTKGAHELRWDKRSGNVWYSASALYQGDGYWEHPTQKPLKLMKKAILLSSDPGDLILDPFAGSGTTLVAAQQLGRRYIGCDLSEEYVEMANARLAKPYTVSMFDGAL